jgi:hypothetical protein
MWRSSLNGCGQIQDRVDALVPLDEHVGAGKG